MPSSAYIAQRDAAGRRVQWLVEIDLDECQLTYTTAPCTAVDQGDGNRCFYTFQTCQDPPNFDNAAATRTVRTYRFCLNDVPFPDDTVPVFPLLDRIVGVPQQIEGEHLSVYPEKVTVQMLYDWTPPPPNRHKSVANTTFIGEFWRNLVARNRNYVNRVMRIYRGFYASGFLVSDFEQVGSDFLIKQIQIEPERCKITAESVLADMDKKQVPFPISDDNTLQANINAAVTTVGVLDVYEYPDPAAYSRNSVYIKIDNEYMKVTARNTGTNEFTVVRERLGSAAASHTAGAKVDHVVLFGTDGGASPNVNSARNVIDVMRDLLEWAGVASADVNTTAFDNVKLEIWPSNEVLIIFTQPQKVSQLMQRLRESRGVVVFIDSAGLWSCSAVAPGTPVATLTDDNFVEGSVSVNEDEESRITRCVIYYDPTTADGETSENTADFTKVVAVVNIGLESIDNYGDVKDSTVFDPFLDPSATVVAIRNLCRRRITRLRGGTRTFSFALETKDAAINVGDLVDISTRHHLGVRGTQDPRTVLISAKKDTEPSVSEYQGIDVSNGLTGKFFRIAPDTVASTFSSASDTDKAFGYWGDANNRLGSTKEPGYIFW